MYRAFSIFISIESCRHNCSLSHQVSLIILHPWSTDEVVLFPPPVAKATEEVVGEEPADGVPDYVNINRLLYPEPNEDKHKFWFVA